MTSSETLTRVVPCPECGGDGGWSYPVSHDPFRNTIREAVQECQDCGGTGEIEIELQPVELEDLEAEQRAEERRALETEAMSEHFRKHPHG